jgi:hypothetical protein
MMRPAIALGAALALAGAPGADAQFAYTLDAAGTTARYADNPSARGFSIAPGLRLELPRSSLEAAGSISAFDNGGWSAQGLLAASIFTPAIHRLRGELAAAANGIAYGDTGRSAYLLARGRLHLAGRTGGGWLGAGAGGTGSHSAGSPLVLIETGAWWRAEHLTITTSLTQSRFRSYASYDAYGGPLPRIGPSSPVTNGTIQTGLIARDRVLNDAVATLHWEQGLLELDGSAGARLRSRTDRAEQWATLSAALWVARTTAIVVSAGRYPEGLMQGFPSVRYAVIGLRFATAAHGHVPERPGRSRNAPPETPRATTFLIAGDTGASYTIRITAPNAQRVEIAADFTDWKAVSLRAVGPGVWQLSLPIAPGTYAVSVRVNGGPWEAPPGVPPRHDEFGESAGVIVVN